MENHMKVGDIVVLKSAPLQPMSVWSFVERNGQIECCAMKKDGSLSYPKFKPELLTIISEEEAVERQREFLDLTRPLLNVVEE